MTWHGGEGGTRTGKEAWTRNRKKAWCASYENRGGREGGGSRERWWKQQKEANGIDLENEQVDGGRKQPQTAEIWRVAEKA